jgi:phage gp36-like protein
MQVVSFIYNNINLITYFNAQYTSNNSSLDNNSKQKLVCHIGFKNNSSIAVYRLCKQRIVNQIRQLTICSISEIPLSAATMSGICEIF